MTILGARWASAFSRRHTSRPFRPGIITSSRTTSGCIALAASMADWPSEATSTSHPSNPSMALRTSRMVGSSSTTSTFRALMVTARGCPWLGVPSLCQTGSLGTTDSPAESRSILSSTVPVAPLSARSGVEILNLGPEPLLELALEGVMDAQDLGSGLRDRAFLLVDAAHRALQVLIGEVVKVAERGVGQQPLHPSPGQGQLLALGAGEVATRSKLVHIDVAETLHEAGVEYPVEAALPPDHRRIRGFAHSLSLRSGTRSLP